MEKIHPVNPSILKILIQTLRRSPYCIVVRTASAMDSSVG